MGLKGYRLSFDEQQKRQNEAHRNARLCRLATVRQQSEVFQSGQLLQYKARLAEAEAAAKHRLRKAWGSRRDAATAALQLRYNREKQLFGKAQREACSWTRAEVQRQSLTEDKRKFRNQNAHRRFCLALRLLRQKDEERQRPTRILIQNRRQEQQRSRRLANAHAATRSPKISVKEKPLRLSTVSENASKIDFRFSRMHQQLGREEDTEAKDSPVSVNANKAARVEGTRLSALEEQVDREHCWAKDRARDRGQVALLREKAIIQRQLLETRQEERKRQELKKQEGLRKKQRHRTFKARANPVVKETKPDVLYPMPAILSNRQNPHPPKAFTSCPNNEVPFLADTAMQVKEEDFKDLCPQVNQEVQTTERSQSVRHIDKTERFIKSTRNNDSTRVTVSTQTKPINSTKARQSVKRASNNASKEPKINPDTSTKSCSRPNTKDLNIAKRPKSRCQLKTYGAVVNPQTHAPQKTEVAMGLPVVCSSEKTSSDRTASQSNLPTCLKTETSRSSQPTSVCQYEDALSEALSMDTDRFMMEYLMTGRRDLPDSSLSSEDNTLEEISSMLTVHDDIKERTHSREQDCRSNDPLTVSISMTPSETEDREVLSFRGPDIPLEHLSISETEFSYLDTSRCDSKESSDLEELMKGLDTISGDSLHLLSCLSDMLTTQPASDISETSTSFLTNISLNLDSTVYNSGTVSLPEPNTKTGEMSETRTETDPSSVALDTILEESDDDLPSISISSISEAMSNEHRCDTSIDCLSIMDGLSLSSVSETRHTNE